MTDSLTTKAVAKLLRVSEATVKRWANSGLLQSDKTVGGHRRFSLNAVAHLRRELGVGPGADTSSRQTAQKGAGVSPPAPVQFADTLLRADEKEAGAMLVEAYLSGAAVTTLFDETITGAMHHVGELWFNGRIGGEGFRDPVYRERFPSEFYADNFAGLAKFTRALIKRRLRGV